MGTIKDQLQTVQAELVREGILAKLHISPRRINHSGRLTQISRGHRFHGLRQHSLYFQLEFVR